MSFNTNRFTFLELHGKDTRKDINRWRVSAYYQPHLAETLFFYTESAYNEFCEANKQKTDIQVYNTWRKSCRF